jgi:chaperonin GroES
LQAHAPDARQDFSFTFCSSFNHLNLKEILMAITPLNDRVLLKRVAGEEKSAGGIIIPDTAKEKPQEGKIIAVGPGKLEKGERLALTVKVGDRVLFGKYSGTEVNFGGEELVLLREEEIFAVIGE